MTGRLERPKMNETATTPPAEPGKYLTFRFENETFGLSLPRVKEIVGIENLRTVPNFPPDVRGVVSVRGWAVPVVDLRVKLGLAPRDDSETTSVIIVRIVRNGEPAQMGIAVDLVTEVVTIQLEHLEPAPLFGTTIPSELLLGMATIAGKAILLPNIDMILDTADPERLLDLSETR